MFWKRSSTAGSAETTADATRSSSAAAPDGLSLEDRLRRVSREDLAAVTVSDIQRVKASVDRETLTSAMMVMMEMNRFSDVLSCSSSATWTAAAKDVTPLQMGTIGTLVRQQISLLYGVLPYVSEEFLDIMRAAFVSHPEDAAHAGK